MGFRPPRPSFLILRGNAEAFFCRKRKRSGGFGVDADSGPDYAGAMTDARERLLETAVELFLRHGYRATGINQIIAETGVAKMTLYHHFRSKEDLILAALRRWDEQSRRWLTRRIDELASTPRDRLLALFDVLEEWFSTKGFRGCLFINAAAEFSEVEHPIHRVAAEHKLLFHRYLLEQARAAGAREPETLALQIALLMEGAIVTAQVSGRTGIGGSAREAAGGLIRLACD